MSKATQFNLFNFLLQSIACVIIFVGCLIAKPQLFPIISLLVVLVLINVNALLIKNKIVYFILSILLILAMVIIPLATYYNLFSGFVNGEYISFKSNIINPFFRNLFAMFGKYDYSMEIATETRTLDGYKSVNIVSWFSAFACLFTLIYLRIKFRKEL